MRNSLADVVSAALRVLGAHGLESCSMRRVAAELDVRPSALYHHVADKQTLLALMADEIVGAASLGSVSDPRAFCVALREAMLAVRDGADVVATAAAFRLGDSEVERALAALVGADGARTLLLFTFGHAQSTQTHRQAAAMGALLAGSGVGDGVGSSVSADLEGVASDLDASFERGLSIILAGLDAASVR